MNTLIIIGKITLILGGAVLFLSICIAIGVMCQIKINEGDNDTNRSIPLSDEEKKLIREQYRKQ